MSLLIESQRTLGKVMLALPPRALRAVAGPEIRSPEGYLLDPQVQAVLRVSDVLGHGEWAHLGVDKARRSMEVSARVLQARPEGALSIHDEVVRVKGGVLRLRVYRPEDRTGMLPVVMFHHGGGFVLGSLESHDGECRALALEVGALVVAVDYRLAPEHRFPTAAQDAVAAYLWVVDKAASLGGDARRMAVMGDSAGGNLAAVVARELRSHEARPVFQLLVYPAVDFTRSQPSHGYFQKGFFLTKSSIDWFIESYAPDHADWTHPMASPFLQKDHEGLAPAFVVTAGFDPLRDEGDRYAEQLRAAGVKVQHRCYEGLVHGFFSMTAGVTAARAAFEDMVAALREALGTA